MDDPDDLTPPEPRVEDGVYALIKAGIASLPMLGNQVIAELLDQFIGPPLTHRLAEWRRNVVTRFLALEEIVEGFSTGEAFQNNPAVVTTFLHASQVALRTHQEEKREALCNAVLNAALPNAPDEDHQAVFLNFVDEFTPSHLWTLNYFNVERIYEVAVRDLRRRGSRPLYDELPLPFIPELSDQQEFVKRVIRDLRARDLVLITQQGIEVGSANMRYLASISNFGRQFLLFITEPQIAS